MTVYTVANMMGGRDRDRVAPEIELPDIPTGLPCHTTWDRTMGGAS
jgi:hypothetical protein